MALGADVVAPVPIATLPLVSGDEQNATVAFITEETIAVARYAPPAKGVFPGSIITVAWRDGNLKASAEEFFSFDTMALGGGLYGVSSGRILSKLTRTPWLLSGKLQKLEDLPSQIVPPEHQGSLVGSLQGFDHWKLYRLGPPLSLVREGPGEILSVSDQVLVSRGDREVRVETIDGNLLGSFQFPPRSKCGGRAEILAPDRLLVTGCGSDRITDFHGKQLRELPPLNGWGFRFGVSLDGSRILFDNHTRRITPLGKLYEAVVDFVSLGLAPSPASTGETIRVVDVTTGGISGRRADISPSGRFVVVVMDDTLSIYRLPSYCAR